MGRILEVLFNILIFSLPFGVLTRISPLPNVFLYLHDVIAGCIFAAFIYKFLIKKEKIHARRVFGSFLIFIAAAIISLIWNTPSLSASSFTISFAYLIRFVIYVSIIFSVGFLRKDFVSSMSPKLVISGMVFVIFGYIQYFYYKDLRNLYYAGWDEHLGRLFSTFFDPNFAGAYIVLIFLLSIIHFYISYQKKQPSILFLISSIICLPAIYLTYSRSAFLMLQVALLAFLYIQKQLKFVLPIAIIMFCLLLIFSNFKVEGLNPLRIASSEARIKSIGVAVSIIQKNPIFGVGFNAYRYAQIRYGYRSEEKTKISNADAGTDNSFLFVFATTGIIGFIAFVNFLKETSVALYKNLEDRKPEAITAIVSIIGLLINSLFINSLFYPLIMTWIFILAGITVSKKQ